MISDIATKRVVLISPSTARVTATAAGTVDMAGARYGVFTVQFCSELNTNAVNPTVAVQQADDTNATSFSTTGIAAAIQTDLTAAHAVHVGVDWKTKKRYARLLITPGTATNDTIVYAAEAELSRMAEAPGSTSEMIGSTNDTFALVT